MNRTLSAEDAVQAIVHRHSALGLDSNRDHDAQPASDAVRDIVFAAARRLGFIPADAQCVAAAWDRQTERTGRFDPAQWPVGAGDFGLSTSQDVPRFADAPHALGVYAVLPSADWVRRMAVAGLNTVQLRFKSSDQDDICREVSKAVDAVRGTGAHLYVNDHWRVALDAGAYGVHLGQEDLDALAPEDLARLRASGVRLGVSTHGYAEMVRANAVRPSYIAMGAVFPTTLKAMPTPPQGLTRLGAYARLLRHLPTVAIGGIGIEHLDDIARTGVGSFAVVRAITGAPDPERAVAALQTAWRQAQKNAEQNEI